MADKVDVIIIGAGLAGLTLANCFNGSSLKVRLLEKRLTRPKAGRADGLKYLTLEIFDALGIHDHVMSDACRHEEICHWGSDEDGNLRRLAVVPDVVPGLDERREVTLAQDKVEQYLEGNLVRGGNVRMERGRFPTRLVIDDQASNDPSSYPVTVFLNDDPRQTTNGTTDLRNENQKGIKEQTVIQARYVVGCDGAKSWTRKEMGIDVSLEESDSIWGVLDVIPKTNFPDIRKACTVRSALSRSMLLEPREGRLVRIYVHLENTTAKQDSCIDKLMYSPEEIATDARNIISPFTFEYSTLEWWSSYHVKQQVANKMSILNRVFIAGDAVHLHSPKAGQGMNASIQDAFNLGWKIRMCLEGSCNPAILKTYELERKPVAHALIDFDRAYVPLFSSSHGQSSETNEFSRVSNHFQNAYVQGLTESSGINIRYEPNILIDDSKASIGGGIAANVVAGMRLQNVKITNQSDGVMIRVQKLFTPDGKFRMLVFPGDISKEREAQRLWELGENLTSQKVGLVDYPVNIITIHAAKRADIELLDLHGAFHPWSNDTGWDYWKVYVDGSTLHEGHCDAYRTLGIGPDGCIILVRPDGYVSLVCNMGDIDRVKAFFADFVAV